MCGDHEVYYPHVSLVCTRRLHAAEVAQLTESRDDAERRGYFTAYAPGRGAAHLACASRGYVSAASPPILLSNRGDV